MRRGQCTEYWTTFRSPNTLLSPATSSLSNLGHIRHQTSLPACGLGPALLHGVLGSAGEQHCISPGFIPSVINDEELKGSCLCFSCGLPTHWWTQFVFQHQMSPAKALLSVLSPAVMQGRGGLEGPGWKQEASVPGAWVPPSMGARCTWGNVLVCRCRGYCKSRPEGSVTPVVHFIRKACLYRLKNWVKLAYSRDAFIFACKTSHPLCHGYSIAFSQIVCNSAFKMMWCCKLSNYQDLNSKTQRFQVIGLMSFIYFNSCQLITNLIRERRLKSKPGSVIILGTHMWIKTLFTYTVWERWVEIYIVSLSIIQICKIIFKWVREAMEITNNISHIRSNLVCNSLWSNQIILLFLTKITL